MANSQSDEFPVGYNNLSDQLVAEILLRLPTKSSVRLKVVCKSWYSLISSPYFIDRFIHLRHHRDVESSLVFQITYDCDRTCECKGYCKRYEFKTISNSSLLYNVGLNYLPCSPSPKHLRLEGSCDDFILCSFITNLGEINYYVINLLTRQWIVISQPPAHAGINDMIGFLCVPPPCSECKSLDISHNKFTVVRLFRTDSLSTFKVQIFSSEDGQWRSLVVSSPLSITGLIFDKCHLVAYRGMLHWLNDEFIAVYDPFNTPETFSRIIHLPIRPPRLRDFCCFKLCVCQGHLRVVESGREDRDHVMDVWELEDYDSGLWNLVHKVYLNNLSYDDSLPITGKSYKNSFLFVFLHPENGDVVYMQKDNGIALVNMKTKIVEGYYPLKNNGRIGNAFHLADKWWLTALLNKSMEAMLV